MLLGKLAPKYHPKTLKLGKYLDISLPVPVQKVFREYKVPKQAKQLFGNDKVGDCTCAGAANMLTLNTCHTGDVVIPTLEEVMAMYSAVSGYVAGDDSTDNGAAMTDVLAYLQDVGLAGHKILGWAQIDHTNEAHRKLACQLFDGTYVGVALPKSAQSQFIEDTQCNWEVVKNSPIEGGHCIIRPGYGAEGDDYVTWANWEVKASAAWSSTYVDEEYVIITEDWINKITNKTPDGLDLDTLKADLNLL